MKTGGLHNFLIQTYRLLGLLLLEIYKLKKFSELIPQISCFAYSHVLTDVSMLPSLNQILFIDAGFHFIWSLIKLQKVILARCWLPWCYALFVSSFSLSAKRCALLISSLCVSSKVTDIPLMTFSIARLIASMLAIDLPVFCLPLLGTPSQTRFLKNLLTMLTTARMVCFAMFVIQVKMFNKL